MIRTVIVLILSWYFLIGCDAQNQRVALQEKETLLTRKEQELAAKEQELLLREEALTQMQQVLDSTAMADSAQAINPAIAGSWNVQMTCTETTCQGSAVGDTKTEQWDISYEGNTVVIRAKAKDQLVRVYTGAYSVGSIVLAENVAETAGAPATKMTVRLEPVSATRMEGQREIVRENNCRIVYSLQLEANTK